MSCPLCLNNKIEHYHQDKLRDYWQCAACQLVFVQPKQFLSMEQEKAIYDLHQNSPDDLGYRKFLSKLLAPLSQKLNQGNCGLDFGSGPGPTVSIMMQEYGYQVDNYDVFYANNTALLNKQYDFITCTEVIEHLHNPNKEIERLINMLKPNAYFAVMTKRVIDKESFKTWHYKNDLTHVCFYSDETFKFIANKWSLNLEIINDDSVIMWLK